MPRAKKPKEGIEQWQRMLAEEETVSQLVDKHHKHLKLHHAAIVVLGRPKANARHGKTIIATCRLAKKSEQLLFEAAKGKVHYIITVALDVWRAMDWKEKEATLFRSVRS